MPPRSKQEVGGRGGGKKPGQTTPRKGSGTTPRNRKGSSGTGDRADPRRGSLHTSVEAYNAGGTPLPTDEPVVGKAAGPRFVTKHRQVHTGIWVPPGTGVRAVWAACSDAGCSIDGNRKTNQDSFLVEMPKADGPELLVGVFDGHGEHGHHVSRQCKAQFGGLLKRQIPSHPDLASATSAAFVEQDHQCTVALDCSQSGTTAVTCHLIADGLSGKVSITTAWAGDSRAVLAQVKADSGVVTKDLSNDQKPERPDEKARIERCGGVCEPVFDDRGQPCGPMRVWYLAQVAPGLAMSRSIGDAVGAMVGVTAEPEVHTHDLSADDTFLLVCSDGVWEFLESRDAAKLLQKKLAGKTVDEETLLAAAAFLCDKARAHWLEEDRYVDDITATVVHFSKRADAAVNNGRGGPAPSGAMGNGGKQLAPEAKPSGPTATPFGMLDSRAGRGPSGGGGTSGMQAAGAPPQLNDRASAGSLASNASGRKSVTSLGPTGKRGAVSGESSKAANAHGGGGGAQLGKVKKSPASVDVLMRSIRDPRHLIFSGMDATAQQLVCDCMFEQQARQGQTVIKQGEYGDIVYIVESGRYEVYLEQAGAQPVASYEAGDSFGELALMYSCARAATVTCTTPGLLWGLDRISYKKIVQQAAASSANDLEAMLKAVAPLRDLDARQLMALTHSMQIVRCSRSQALLKPGSGVEALYVVQSGSMSYAEPQAASRTLRRGDYFGEEALQGARASAAGGSSATVVALEDSVLARITRESFAHYVGALEDIKREHFNERALGGCKELAALSPAERRQICKLMSKVNYPAGSTIVKEGGLMTQLHVVHSGEVGEYKSGRPAATLAEGVVFGQKALFRHESASNSFVAQKPTMCMVVSRESVQRQLGPLGAILDREAEKLARKAQASQIAFGTLAQKKVLGVGTFGTVKLVVAAENKEAYALKCMRKQKVYEMGQVEHTVSECRLLSECEHPFIVRLVRLFEDAASLYLLLELTLGGELFSVLRAEKCFPERRCCFYSAMIVAAFEYLHSLKIVYRDLKPENLLVDADGYLKVVDFGFAKRVEDRTWTVCGTPEYMAPEIILNKGHGKAVDWWTVGILLYELFIGYPPFEGNDAMDLYKKIVAGDVKYPKKITPSGQDLIRQLLMQDQKNRLGSAKGGAEDVKRHAFYKKLSWQSLLAKKIEAPFKPKISSMLDTSNFEEFDDPDKNVPLNTKLPKGLFDEFSALTRIGADVPPS